MYFQIDSGFVREFPLGRPLFSTTFRLRLTNFQVTLFLHSLPFPRWRKRQVNWGRPAGGGCPIPPLWPTLLVYHLSGLMSSGGGNQPRLSAAWRANAAAARTFSSAGGVRSPGRLSSGGRRFPCPPSTLQRRACALRIPQTTVFLLCGYAPRAGWKAHRGPRAPDGSRGP